MQVVSSGCAHARVGFVVPRWTQDPVHECQGVPFRAMTAAGALVAAECELVWCDQEPDLDRSDARPELRAALATASVVFLWMQELDPLTQTANAIRIANEIRSWYPELPIAVGGEFVTLTPGEAFDVEPPFDFVVRGYGEDGAPALVRALRGELPFTAVPGLIWRDAGTLRRNEMARNTKLNRSHLALYELLDLSGYIHRRGGIFGNGEPTLVIGTSRGCPKRCTFCYWSTHEPSMLDASDVVELAASLNARYGVRQFHIGELDFATNRKRVLAVARAWKERIPDCTWFALMSPSDAMRFTDEDWDLIAAGGCRKIEFGTETGSSRMLTSIGKRHQPRDPVVLTRKLLARRIMPMHNFVFGFVGETRADRLASLRLIRELQALENSEWVFFTFRFYQAAWGTKMGAAAIERTPDYPRTVAEMLPYRLRIGREDEHSMRWLRPGVEREIKRMAGHYLPLTTSKFGFKGILERVAYRALRGVAQLRLRAGWFGLSWDRWLYRRVLQRSLDNTYRL